MRRENAAEMQSKSRSPLQVGLQVCRSPPTNRGPNRKKKQVTPHLTRDSKMEVEDAAGGDDDVAGTAAPQARLAGEWNKHDDAAVAGILAAARAAGASWRLRAVRRRCDQSLV